jgi:hypothetical protein
MVETLTELNAGNSSRASHVWRMDGPAGTQIARRPWWSTPEVSPFMAGLDRLFGVDPRNLDDVAAAYTFWRGLGVWTVPEALGMTEVLGGPALKVEYICGEAGRELQDADASALGQKVAAAHEFALDYFGPVTETGARGWLVGDFYPRVLGVLDRLTTRFPLAGWEEFRSHLSDAPAPRFAVPMLLDWAGEQFVWREGQPYALVDVEASVYAPPELDLCLWELLLSPAGAAEFQAAYARELPFPDLTHHRTACRLLLRALEVEGSPPLADWLALPALFQPPRPAAHFLP